MSQSGKQLVESQFGVCPVMAKRSFSKELCISTMVAVLRGVGGSGRFAAWTRAAELPMREAHQRMGSSRKYGHWTT